MFNRNFKKNKYAIAACVAISIIAIGLYFISSSRYRFKPNVVQRLTEKELQVLQHETRAIYGDAVVDKVLETKNVDAESALKCLQGKKNIWSVDHIFIKLVSSNLGASTLSTPDSYKDHILAQRNEPIVLLVKDVIKDFLDKRGIASLKNIDIKLSGEPLTDDINTLRIGILSTRNDNEINSSKVELQFFNFGPQVHNIEGFPSFSSSIEFDMANVAHQNAEQIKELIKTPIWGLMATNCQYKKGIH